jgi:hypothetical protein
MPRNFVICKREIDETMVLEGKIFTDGCVDVFDLIKEIKSEPQLGIPSTVDVIHIFLPSYSKNSTSCLQMKGILISTHRQHMVSIRIT